MINIIINIQAGLGGLFMLYLFYRIYTHIGGDFDLAFSDQFFRRLLVFFYIAIPLDLILIAMYLNDGMYKKVYGTLFVLGFYIFAVLINRRLLKRLNTGRKVERLTDYKIATGEINPN